MSLYNEARFGWCLIALVLTLVMSKQEQIESLKFFMLNDTLKWQWELSNSTMCFFFGNTIVGPIR